jgi:aminodeoxyfutalosine synthase
MSASASLDQLLARVAAGERLSGADLRSLDETPDILRVGMLADACRTRLHGTRVTYVRVAGYALDALPDGPDTSLATEVRLTGQPASVLAAIDAVRTARRVAGDRVLSAWSWMDVERLSSTDGASPTDVASRLKQAGLDAVAEVPCDRVGALGSVVDALVKAGFEDLRLTMESAVTSNRVGVLLAIASEQDRVGRIRVLNPLPTRLNALRPTTGYDDVKIVALARLAVPNISSIQVDWLRYGPKLAQVALTFGADDLDQVSPTDDSSEGRRRAPIEDVRRNVQAAGFTPAERDGHFHVLA